MAKIKISALPETASLQATDLITAVANFTSSKVTIKNLANNLTQVTSSINALTASFVTGSNIFGPYGQNSVVSSSHSVSSSYALNGGVTSIIAGTSITVSPVDGKGSVTVNYAGGGGAFPYTGTAVISGSLVVTGSASFTGSVLATEGGFTGSLFGTSSWALNVVGGSGGSFPYTGSAIISGSLTVIQSGSSAITVTGSLLMTQSRISTVDYLDFAINPPTPPHNEGRIHWDIDRKTLELDTEVNNFMISVGHVNVLRGRNDNSYTLTAGTAVYINGSSGQFATFGTASWEDDPNSAYTIGIIPQNINPSNSGYAVIQGEITGINTSAYTPGTLIYLSSSGQYTDQKPVAPRHGVRLGQVVVSGVSGKLQIKVDNGYETDELHDVLLANTSSGDLFVKSGSLWINTKQLTGSYGLTGSLTVTGSILTTGTITAQTLVVQTVTSSIVYSSGSNIFGNEATNIQQFTGSLRVTGSGNHFIVGGNFGLNTASPSYRLDVSGSARITGSLAVGNITPSATVGRIDASNDVVAFSTSDIRYKTNIVPIYDAVDKVNQIRGVHFDWVEDTYVHGNSGRDIGVIAQELEAILPEVVTTRENGVKAVKYDKIVPLLIEAIKDLQRQINELKTRE